MAGRLRLQGSAGFALLLSLILLIKIAVVTVAMGPAQAMGLAPYSADDKDLYSDIARCIVAGDGYRVSADTAETMVRNPGYVFLRAGLMLAFGESLLPVRVCNILFGMGTVLLSAVMIRRFTTNVTAAVVTVVISGLYPLVLLTESRVGVESMFAFLLMLSVLLLSSALESLKVWLFAVSGVVLGIATLTRSVAMFMIPAIAIVVILAGLKEHRLRRALQCVVGFVVCTLLVVLPWIVRNYQLSGEPTFSESHVGIGAYQGWYTTEKMGEGKPYQMRIKESRKLQSEIAAAAGAKFRVSSRDDQWDIYPTIRDELLYSNALMVEVFKYYRADPLMLLRHLSANLVRFWFQGATDKLTILITVLQVPLLFAAAAGVVRSIDRGGQLLLLLIPVLVVWVLHAPLIAHARYSVPLVPILAVLAGLLWASRKPRVAAASPVGI